MELHVYFDWPYVPEIEVVWMTLGGKDVAMIKSMSINLFPFESCC